MPTTNPYSTLRQVAPGAGGRSKAGGYDLVDYNTPGYRATLVLAHSTGLFTPHPHGDQDPVVLAHLRAHGLLAVGH